MRRILVALTVGLPMALASVAPAVAEPPAPSQIKHLVVIVEQNSTFDHTFGSLPLVRGIKSHAPVPQRGNPSLHMQPSSRIAPTQFSVPPGEELLSNGSASAKGAFNDGSMNGFWDAQERAGKNAAVAFTQLDSVTATPWSRLAGQGVIFDNYFSSVLGGSLPNTLNLVAGTSAGYDKGASTDLSNLWDSQIPTIFDAASAQGVSWRYYVGGLNQIKEKKVAKGSYAASPESTPSPLYWAPILSMRRFWERPTLAANVRTQNDFFADAATGSLPSITYVLPQPTTHEPLSLPSDLRLLSLINALRTSPNWHDTAVMVVWDDWGGYYDHVKPPTAPVDGQQLGFRVPALLLSPRVEPNQVSHRLFDHSSVPALAASLFHLKDFQATRTNDLKTVWSDTWTNDDRIVALTHPDHYVAAGMVHAPAVFILYLLTVVVITGVLFWVGVSMRGAPSGREER